MTTEKELGEALKRGDSTIEVELDLARKVIKIKTVRNGMWALCVTAIGGRNVIRRTGGRKHKSTYAK